MGQRDQALRYFLADAKAQGISLREYQRRYNIRLLPAELETAAHEFPANISGDGDGEYDHCESCRQKRLVARFTVE